MEKKHSGFGLASFILSLVVGVSMFLVFGVAGVLEASTPGGMDEESVAVMAIGLAAIALLFGDLIALALGVVGLFQKDKKRVFAILGTIFASVTMVMTIGVVLLGLLLQ